MLRLPITYKDLDDVEHTEEFEFHFFPEELIEINARFGDLEAWMHRVSRAHDTEKAYAEMKKIVLDAYGERSEDRKRFKKTEELRSDFEDHAAFSQLMLDIFTKEGFLEKFMAGIIPPPPEQDKPPAGPPVQTATQ